jgi:hypothetical protein
MPTLIDVPPLYSYIVLGLLVVFKLPSLGHAVLAFMRDLEDYRRDRPK